VTRTVPTLPPLPPDIATAFRDVANAALIVGGVGCGVFAVLYHLLTRWRATPLGRNVMAFMIALFSLVIIAAIRAFIPWLNSWTDLLRMIAYSITAWIIWDRIYLLVKFQVHRDYGGNRHHDRATNHDDEDDEDDEATPPRGVRT
jgi:hypothetical protein